MCSQSFLRYHLGRFLMNHGSVYGEGAIRKFTFEYLIMSKNRIDIVFFISEYLKAQQLFIRTRATCIALVLNHHVYGCIAINYRENDFRWWPIFKIVIALLMFVYLIFKYVRRIWTETLIFRHWGLRKSSDGKESFRLWQRLRSPIQLRSNASILQLRIVKIRRPIRVMPRMPHCMRSNGMLLIFWILENWWYIFWIKQ